MPIHCWLGDRKSTRPVKMSFPIVPRDLLPEELEEKKPLGQLHNPGSPEKLPLKWRQLRWKCSQLRDYRDG